MAEAELEVRKSEMILPLNERQFLIGKLEGIEQQFMAEA